jgi:hypothetical protein
MLFFLALVLGAVVTGLGEVTDSDIIGTWRFEDDESIEELTFNPDHSFAAISKLKFVLSTPPVGEQHGTWRIEEATLTIEAGWVNIPNDRRIRSGTFDAISGRLVVSDFDANKSRQYSRFDLPSCRDAHAVTPGLALRESLCGLWKMHYHTRDDYYRLLQNGEVSIGFFSDEWNSALAGQWRIEGSNLIMRVKNADRESAEYQDRTFLVTRSGSDCFVIQTDEKEEYTLRRAEEPNAPPPDAFLSTLPSPLPTETPSPAH